VAEFVWPEIVGHVEGDVSQEALGVRCRQIITLVEPGCLLRPVGVDPSLTLYIHNPVALLREPDGDVGKARRRSPALSRSFGRERKVCAGQSRRLRPVSATEGPSPTLSALMAGVCRRGGDRLAPV
jgi:hypothetical protein